MANQTERCDLLNFELLIPFYLDWIEHLRQLGVLLPNQLPLHIGRHLAREAGREDNLQSSLTFQPDTTLPRSCVWVLNAKGCRVRLVVILQAASMYCVALTTL